MDRKDFLCKMGLGGVWLSSPSQRLTSNHIDNLQTTSCVLIPSETAGPFPLDLTENSTYFRQDIRESQQGIQLNVRLKIVGFDNCEPLQNVRVNIWHCDKDGVYSGYNTGNNPGDTNATHLRGYQFTDAYGEVEFITIFPGWYTGRICHIHFQVYVSSSYSAISQLTFPITIKNNLYSENSALYTKGADPLSFEDDNIFSDGHEYQLATLEENSATGGYSTYLEVTVEGSGTSPDCEQSLVVANPIDQALYQVSEDIESAGQINLTDVTFKAGTSITLLEGFEVSTGYTFSAEIDPCTTSVSARKYQGHLERQSAQVFEIGQNYPNPYNGITLIPLDLRERAEIEVELWSLEGKKVTTILKEMKDPGKYIIKIDLKQYSIPLQTFVYQTIATTSHGVFRVPKMMTVKKEKRE